nr:hypothetical protein BaRGS_035369 [Batillaria attramentaria]
MKDANKLVSKCLYLNIVKSTESEEVLQKFLTVGGWDTLNKWLQQARDDENAPLLVELLKVYQGLPVHDKLKKKKRKTRTGTGERDKEKDSSRDKEKDKDRHRHSKSSDKKDSSHNSSKKDSIRKDSTEKKPVFQLSRHWLPDSPSEPDLESVEPAETKIIPLEDETSSAEEYEHTYNVDPAAMPYDPAFDISQNLGNVGPGAAGNGGGGGNGAGGGMGGIQLPPDLSNILASIQQQSIATGGQSLQANSAVMANVQSILSSIMHGGPGANSEELINKLRVALDPLKNQISAPVPAMTPQDPGQQFPPQGPQRHGLLGNAPPGFTPMMGGPRPFGPPQGPGMGRGMEGEGWNMGMGPGPMGPGFHPMPGPMNMGGPRPRGTPNERPTKRPESCM